jgi:DNA-binding NarL/FixJ family response regulator
MRGSVLIVDDDAGFRRLAVRMLEARGLTVAGEAEDARGAVAAAEALQPDAALIDVGLPDRNGIDLAGELAALPCSPRILLISSDAEVAWLQPRTLDGHPLPFVAKQDLPGAPLERFLGAE